MCIGCNGCCFDFFPSCIGCTVSDVFGNCSRKEGWLLTDDANLISVPMKVELLQIKSLEFDGTFIRVVKSLNEANRC